LVDPTSGWTKATFDLSAYVGQSVRIRFDFTSDSSDNFHEGWYVDDVAVTGATLSPATANATWTGASPNEFLGASVASVGFFNNDAREDFAILRSGNGQGEAYMFYGRPSTGPAFTSGVIGTLANVTFTATKPFDRFALRTAGDLDNDGLDELLITPKFPSALADGLPPQTYLIFGRDGLSGAQNLQTLPNRIITGRDASWVALGDVNGDGFDDLGANNYVTRPGVADPAASVRHAVGEIFLGRADLRTATSLSTPDLVIEPGKPNYDLNELRDNLFRSPGDLNGDGKADFVLADTFGGYARVFSGRALLPADASGPGTGPATQPVDEFELPLANPTDSPTTAGNVPGVSLGSAGATPDVGDAFDFFGGVPNEQLGAPRPAGDLNNDGVADVIVSSATVPVEGQPVAADGTGSAAVALVGVNPRSIVSLDVISVDATTGAETVVLTGLAEEETSQLKFFANVRVTAPPASSVTQPTDPTAEPVTGNGKGNGKGKAKKPKKVKGPKGPKVKKVHGHALAKSTIVDGVKKKHQFLFVAHGGPASATLNVVVDGLPVATVNSTKNGKVMFKSLPGVDLEAIDLLTITDATGVAVMQADFYP
jgi:hypothetical protein